MKPIRHIPAGDHVIMCTHINANAPNPRVHVFDMAHRMFDPIREVDHANKAKWIMVCSPCKAAGEKGDALAGVPYKNVQLSREVSLGS